MAPSIARFTIRFWGVRGSIPTPGPETVCYGGNTTCIEVRCDDTVLILDTGTGVRKLGALLMAEAAGQGLHASILYSHLHLDHIQGFPFFGPIYSEATHLDIYAAVPKEATPREVLASQMTYPSFPVGLAHLPARLEFHDVVAGDRWTIGPAVVETCPIPHPGGAMAIRINHRGHAFVQCTDIEHTAAGPPDRLLALARGADYLSYDTTYDDGAEYEAYRGWGHSTWREGLKVARAADVGTFIAFHHDPSHDDAFMDRIAAKVAAECPGALVAREGMALDLLGGTMTSPAG